MTDTGADHSRSEISFLLQYDPFNKMDQVDLSHLLSHARISTYQKNEIIHHLPNTAPSVFHIIKQGRVRGEVASTDDANPTPVWELGPGECFPIGALLSNRPSQTQHRATEETVCLEIPKQVFQYLLERSEPFRDFCTQRLSHLLSQVIRDMQASTLTTVSEDSSLNTPLRNLLAANPISCSPDTPIRTALEKIEAAQRRSIAIIDAEQHPIGILTLRDVMARVTLTRVDIESPIRQVMTPMSEFLSPDNFAYEAALFMAERNSPKVCCESGLRFFRGRDGHTTSTPDVDCDL